MTTVQKIIKYLAMAFAVYLIVMIFGGIFSALGIFTVFFSGESVSDDATSYSVSQDISDLSIEINAADLIIRQGDKFALKSNLKRLEVNEENGCLTVTESAKLNVNYKGASLILEVPENYIFNQVKIKTGAGRLTIDSLAAKELSLDLGAGEAVIGTLNVSEKSSLNGGAGRITVNAGSLNHLDFDIGAGEVALTSRLSGDSEIDCGIGNMKLTLIGGREEYRVEFDKGIGSATIDGTDVKDGTVVGTGANTIEIDGGIGGTTVTFADE